MSYTLSLYNDLIEALEDEFGGEVSVSRYRGELSSAEDMDHTMGLVLRMPQIRVQFDTMQEGESDSTGQVALEQWDFSLLVMASNMRGEEEQEEDVLQILDRVAGAIRGRFPSFAGFAGFHWSTNGFNLELSIPGLVAYSIPVQIDTYREAS